jgi:hypothetical protein
VDEGKIEMTIEFKHIGYSALKAKQKENFNFQKISGVLADYGFSTVRLTDDWQGADFIAQHADGKTFLRVQLKPRLFFKREYMNKDLQMCFRDGDDIYLFPHDEALQIILDSKRVMHGTRSWEIDGGYSWRELPKWIKPLLQKYKLQGKLKSEAG